MKLTAHLLSLWESIRASYWFVPSAMSLAAILLSFTMVWIDAALPEEILEEATWVYTGTAEGARTLLATIASSMIGLAGVVFSITIVSLTLASGQFGPRLLRNFMRDTGNQITLGTFLAAFLYCLLVLRKIKGTSDDLGIEVFVPQLSILLAVLIAIAGLGVLIYFIHHAAEAIQAPNVIASVAEDLVHSIQTLYPELIGQHPHEVDQAEADAAAQVPSRFLEESRVILAGSDGYVLRIEPEQLLAITREHDLIVRVERHPGQFVHRDDPVLRAWPEARLDDSIIDALRDSFATGDQRSWTQDTDFVVEQLVEVAVRALSPGVNDPFTAIQCVDRLGAAMSELARRRFPSTYRVDDEGRLRVVAEARTRCDFFDTSFNQIRQYAKNSLDVLIRILEALARIAVHIRHESDWQCLSAHISMTYELAVTAATAERDRQMVERRYAEAQLALQASAAAPAATRS
ncbi:DUF2254 domain-containing protein [Candidatus Laterigemmans baculatus]|uniref:DUF2254 domain-containing protein n=1 Tax=Candidatus Laterigemmans baculatus TaxID=2770505 RepID=UPI0013DC5DBF|nr:DUF2254 domain-containing protein [Candidatus Laterigemmans baculatus]